MMIMMLMAMMVAFINCNSSDGKVVMTIENLKKAGMNAWSSISLSYDLWPWLRLRC